MDEEDLRKRLTPQEYHVLREKGTEAPFVGKYVKTKEKGMYVCKACGQPLFSSDTKFESGTGWPSFYDAIAGSVEFHRDDSYGGFPRTEVVCSKCKSHLGHIFNDAEDQPTGKRYCMNSVCLDLVPDDSDAKK